MRVEENVRKRKLAGKIFIITSDEWRNSFQSSGGIWSGNYDTGFGKRKLNFFGDKSFIQCYAKEARRSALNHLIFNYIPLTSPAAISLQHKVHEIPAHIKIWWTIKSEKIWFILTCTLVVAAVI